MRGVREEYYVSDIGRSYSSGQMKEAMSVVVSLRTVDPIDTIV